MEENHDKLKTWCLEHINLLPYVHYFQNDKQKQQEAFLFKREKKHQSLRKKLLEFIAQVEKLCTCEENRIDQLSEQEIPDLPYACYDDKNTIILLRKLTAMQQELRGYQIELATKQYGYFKDRIEQSHEIIQLLQSDIIPTDYMCCVCSEFFEYLEPESSSRLQNSIKYLYYYVERTKSHIETLPKAPWHQDFRPFFTQLVIDSRSRVISDISYIFPMEIEVSLSQCFFCYKSPYQYEIDLLINTFTKVDHATFTRELIDFALRIIPKRASLTPQEQSIAFVILYRCLFQRCYERFPHYFAPKPNPNLIKLEKLASLPSKYFHLPTEYIHVGDGEESIRNLFRNINFYHSASLFLYESIFCPNPIDALYYIHKELIGVQKAAIIIQKGSNLASLSDIKQLICFDDLFSLFLGTTLSSEHPDIFYTFWMIDSFLDKESLSPPFEYAERNFEGLISHCQSIDLESYVKENE